MSKRHPKTEPQERGPTAISSEGTPDGAAAAPAAVGEEAPLLLVVMGVSGCGKTTIGRLLAERLGWPFQEGDALHPPDNVARMHAGTPLTDAERWPWLQRISEQLEAWRRSGSSGLITCSALARRYRDFLRAGRPEVRFLYLKGERPVIAARLAARRGHFMPPGLLDSQFAALEPPSPEEPVIEVDITLPLEAVVERIEKELKLVRTPVREDP